MNNIVGKPLNRVTGPVKVTGKAKYAAEFALDNLAYGVIISSTIAKGRITDIDTSAIKAIPGVIGILTHQNAPQLPFQKAEELSPVELRVGEQLKVLQSDRIFFDRQPIGVVIADTLEGATEAAKKVKISYSQEDAQTSLEAQKGRAKTLGESSKGGRPSDTVRGNPQASFANAAIRIDQSYIVPTEHHSAMEPHATIAAWSGDNLTLYDKTQWPYNVRNHIALAFGISQDNIRVVSPFVGGAFGNTLRVWPHVLVAIMAAQQVNRPVKLVLERHQTFGTTGYRPHVIQRVALGADKDGRINTIIHEGLSGTSRYQEFAEGLFNATEMLYDCDNIETHRRLVDLDIGTPGRMRGPGAATGSYALECALDELAYAVAIEPMELRLQNYAEVNPKDRLPWSSKYLREAYQLGADKFGWANRNPTPRSMSDGQNLIGWGMASSTYPMHRSLSNAKAQILSDGTAIVQSATTDIGTGTYVTMTQIAADALGMSPENIKFQLGDSKFPYAPFQGGSQTIASVGSAVRSACTEARNKALALAKSQNSWLSNADRDDVVVEEGMMFLKQNSARRLSYGDILKQAGQESIEVEMAAQPGDEKQSYSMHAFGAVFVEVRVDELLGDINVSRVVSAIDIGKVINKKTARSQTIGGIVGGVGMALREHTLMDDRYGRFMNANLGEYLVPVNADIGQIEAYFVGEPDYHANPLGAKGIGEIAIVGVAAAIANAVYHATGKRVRDLPITLDKLL